MVDGHSRDYVEIAKQYARDVARGKLRKVTGKLEQLACKRFLADLQRARKKSCAIYFDEWHGADPCDFVEKLPHVEGEWETPNLRLEPWQIFILVCVFGFRRRDTGHRRFNTVYIEVARKNGKSAFTSAVSLYCLTCEGEVGPQVKVAATTGDQARIVFDVCKAMADKTPELCQAFDLSTFASSIVCGGNSGTIKPINAKASTQDGLNPHLSVIDELHAHKDRKLFDVLKSARGARRNPLSWYITTAGYSTAGVCYEQRELVRKILEGVIEADHYFGAIYTLDKADIENETAWQDERLWRKANPNLGISANVDELRTYLLEAKQSPATQGEFKTKRLNIWLNASSAWLSLAHWSNCVGDYRIEDFAGQRCYVGADLASKNDLAAVIYLFESGDKLVFFEEFYLPRELVEKAGDRADAPYQSWADAGHIRLTDGNMTDNNLIEADILARAEVFDIQSMIFDKYGAFDICSRLDGAGFNAQLLQKNAGNMTDPATDIEARYEVQRLGHRGNPVMTWMASNVVIERRVDGSILPKKPSKDSPLKIDGIDALCNAVWAYLMDTGVTSYIDEEGCVMGI